MSSNSQPSTTEPINQWTPKQFVFDENQRALIAASFQRNRVFTAAKMKRLAQESGMPENSVRNWFKTRRNKERRSIIEQLANSPAANDVPANHAPGAGLRVSVSVSVSKTETLGGSGLGLGHEENPMVSVSVMIKEKAKMALR
ncbi:hypothetical protein AAVH_40782 [Aphelenchoides avenae]|nr:hypothetical protein AAVH_40782 [Aphelenchus avenae]